MCLKYNRMCIYYFFYLCDFFNNEENLNGLDLNGRNIKLEFLLLHGLFD